MESTKRGRWWYDPVVCSNCKAEKLARRDCVNQKRSQLCRSCASKERAKQGGFSEKLRQVSTSHGQSKTPTWNSWARMRRRCRQGRKHHARYENTKVCDRWESFENFLEDMGERPSLTHTIDRIDNEGDYCPGNCRWATPKQQSRNRSNNRNLRYNGKTQCLVDWAKEVGLTKSCLESRLNRGWSLKESLETPTLTNSTRSQYRDS